jgi:hypothetical protein
LSDARTKKLEFLEKMRLKEEEGGLIQERDDKL